MINFVSMLYEWFGFCFLYSHDLAAHLKGFDITCSGFSGTPYYLYAFSSILIISFVMTLIYYWFIDSVKFNRRSHWVITLLMTGIFSMGISFWITYHPIINNEYCNQLAINFFDVIGFAFDNFIFSLLFFTIFSSLPWPRRRSINCHLTPWKQ